MLSEDDLEQQCLKWFAEQDWEVLHGPDIAPDGDNPLRASFHDVFLRPVMLEQLQTINPHLPVSVLEEVILRIAHAQSPDLVVSNKAFQPPFTSSFKPTVSRTMRLSTIRQSPCR